MSSCSCGCELVKASGGHPAQMVGIMMHLEMLSGLTTLSKAAMAGFTKPTTNGGLHVLMAHILFVGVDY